MSNELKMAKVESILSLRAKGWSQQQIAEALDIDRGTVSRYLRQAAEAAQLEATSSGTEPGRQVPKPANLPTGSDPKTRNLPTGSEGRGVLPETANAPTGPATRDGDRQPADPPRAAAAAASQRPGPCSDCEPWREVIRAKAEQGLSAVRIH